MSQAHIKERLLTAAREVFAESGFQGATVREICRRAEANVAAVNYHFGSKDELLAAALSFNQLRDLQLANADPADAPTLRLQRFILGLMRMLLDEHHPASQCRIIARELADPTPLLDQIVAEAVVPLYDFFHGVLREIAGPDLPEAVLRRCVLSVVAQCFHYRHSAPVLQRVYPDMHHTAEDIEQIAAHITQFSLAGLRDVAS